MKSTLARRRSRAGFTLVEILAVIMVILIVSGIILVGAKFATDFANRKRAEKDLQQIGQALDKWRLDFAVYPDWAGGGTTDLSTLASNEQVKLKAYVPEVSTTDPWGRGYQYQRLTKYQYKLWSQGASATLSNDDITNQSGNN